MSKTQISDTPQRFDSSDAQRVAEGSSEEGHENNFTTQKLHDKQNEEDENNGGGDEEMRFP